MPNPKRPNLADVTTSLNCLREAIKKLERSDLPEVDALEGHQSVDTQSSLNQCVQVLERLMTEMDDTVAMLAEAVGERGKL